MNDRELDDLGQLAMQRCRRAAKDVMQLLDKDEDAAAVLVAVARDMIRGAIVMLTTDERSQLEAARIVLHSFSEHIKLDMQVGRAGDVQHH